VTYFAPLGINQKGLTDGTKTLQEVYSPAWNPAGVAPGQKKTLAGRGRYLEMLGGTPNEAELSKQQIFGFGLLV
jgi:hypothetical protein